METINVSKTFAIRLVDMLLEGFFTSEIRSAFKTIADVTNDVNYDKYLEGRNQQLDNLILNINNNLFKTGKAKDSFMSASIDLQMAFYLRYDLGFSEVSRVQENAVVVMPKSIDAVLPWFMIDVCNGKLLTVI